MALPTTADRLSGYSPKPSGIFGSVAQQVTGNMQQPAPQAPNYGTPPISKPIQAVPLSGGAGTLGSFGGGGAGGGGFQSTYSRTPGPGGSATPMQGSYQVDQGFTDLLAERMGGNLGGPSWEQIVEGQFDPFSSLLDRQYEQSKESAITDLARRGVLQSGETVQAMSNLSAHLADLKGQRLGELASEFEERRQRGIENAIQAFGILQGQEIGRDATITSANIGAAAQVQSASIQAGATVQAASIGAQAAIQAAGMNASVALAGIQAQNERFLIGEGLDPVAFQTDPVYRAAWVATTKLGREQETMINDIIIRDRGTDTALPRR